MKGPYQKREGPLGFTGQAQQTWGDSIRMGAFYLHVCLKLYVGPCVPLSGGWSWAQPWPLGGSPEMGKTLLGFISKAQQTIVFFCCMYV